MPVMTNSRDTPHIPERSSFSELEAACAKTITALNGLSYDSTYYPHIVSVALFNNCLETALAIAFLSKAQTDGGYHILLRALFESAARLKFIAKSPENNALVLERIDCKEILRQTGKSPIQGEPRETTELRRMASERDEALDKERIQKVSFKDILAEIKLTPLYPLYQTLSGVTHAQITPLLQQILIEQPNGAKFEMLCRLTEEKRQAFQEITIALLQLAQLNMQRILGHFTSNPTLTLLYQLPGCLGEDALARTK